MCKEYNKQVQQLLLENSHHSSFFVHIENPTSRLAVSISRAEFTSKPSRALLMELGYDLRVSLRGKCAIDVKISVNIGLEQGRSSLTVPRTTNNCRFVFCFHPMRHSICIYISEWLRFSNSRINISQMAIMFGAAMMNLHRNITTSTILLSLALIDTSLAQNKDISIVNWNKEQHWQTGELNCTYGLREFNELTQKRVYTVGVHAPAGEDKAFREFNLTFVTYLNEVVGKRWDPPIEFRMTTTENPLVSWIDEGEEVDFMYSDTGIYSCVGTEIGSQPLGTTIADLKTRGHEYELDMHG
eukprot:scaffold5022_cov110-Cylindrotheca_fusiformis.AAC.2